MRNILIIALFILVSRAFSITIDSDKGSLNYNIWGQPSYLHEKIFSSGENRQDNRLDIGRYRLEGAFDFTHFSYSLIFGYEEKDFELIELYAKYKFNKNVSLSAGLIKAPFGRMNSTYDSELLMFNRNPLVTELTPKSGFGVCSEIALLDSTIIIGLAGYEEVLDEYNQRYQNGKVDFSGVVHYMPFGKMDMSETAVNKYDELRMDFVPGFHYNAIHEFTSIAARTEKKMTSLEGGLHTALRYSYLAFDAMVYYSHIFSDDKPLNEEGYSVQLGYAFWGKLEPSTRYSHYKFNESGIISFDTFELGTAYYIKGQKTKVGFNYSYKEFDSIEYDLSEYRIYAAFKI